MDSEKSVSNPWREAIEEEGQTSIVQVNYWFPILGGRLLKKFLVTRSLEEVLFPLLRGRLLKVFIAFIIPCLSNCFQSLEGGY